MAEKELRRMSRPELIEIIYALKSNEESLQKKNAHLEEQLNDRTIQISEAGSIAEAALQLNDIFSTAQIAADDYLTSIKAANVSMEEEQKAAAKEAERVVAEAQAQAEQIVAEANAEAARIMTMAKEKADNTLSEAEAASQHMTDTAQKKAEVLKAQSEDKAQTCVELAQKQSQDMITAAEQKRDQLEEACREKSEETQKELEARWDAFEKRVGDVLSQHRELSMLLKNVTAKPIMVSEPVDSAVSKQMEPETLTTEKEQMLNASAPEWGKLGKYMG